VKLVELKLEETEHLSHLPIREVFAMAERGEIGTPIEDEKPAFKIIEGGLK